MKRRKTKIPRLKPGEERRPGEGWVDWLRRLYPRECLAAERRRDRNILLYRWPRVVEVKTEYHRRNR